MSEATCRHDWRETGITHTASGRRWQQVSECFYCPNCRQFSRRIRWFLDGQFYATEAAARRANAEENALYAAAKADWLREHYPEHAPIASNRPATV